MRVVTACLAVALLGAIVADAAKIKSTFTMSTANNVPACTSATGSGSGMIEVDLTTMAYTLSATFSGASSTATAAHIHGPAATTASAAVVKTLTVSTADSTISGSGTFTSAELENLIAGNYYVNLHTSSCAPGEIRGNVLNFLESTGATALVSASSLSTANNVPSCSSATGTGAVVVAVALTTNGVYAYSVSGSYSGASSTVTASHIHGPATTSTSAPVIAALTVDTSARTIVGTGLLTRAQLAALLTGQYYVNVHTSSCAPGEVRGNLLSWSTSSNTSSSAVSVSKALVLALAAVLAFLY